MDCLIAKAKINIGLDIKKFYPEYKKHKIKSIFCLVDDYYDEVLIAKSNTDEVKYYDSFNQPMIIDDDLVTKTLIFMKQHFYIQDCFSITIRKGIPTQSGLGGASSDAAAIINYFVDKYNIEINGQTKFKIATELGSDICFFLAKTNLALVSQFGNVVRPIKKPRPKFVIIRNGFGCSTAEVYRSFMRMPLRHKNKYHKIIKRMPYLKHVSIYNDLQCQALLQNEHLLKFYDSFKSSRKIIMTGSGSFFISFDV